MLDALLRASLQGGAYALAVWGLCALAPRLPASARALLWWLVSLKFLLALAGPSPIPLPLLRPVAAPMTIVETSSQVPAPLPSLVSPIDPLGTAVVAVWALLVSAGLGRTALDLRRARRLRRSAREAPEAARLVFERLRHRLRVHSPVHLAVSTDVTAPVVLGPWRPLVLIPAQGSALKTEEDLEMALAHELLHVRRRDLWLAAVPHLARVLFPFHPLARLAAREERLAREAACDAAVLRALGHAPRAYGQLLLRFGAVPALPGAAQGAPTFRSLRRRLQMLDHADRVHGRARALAVACVVLALVALVPFIAVARPQEEQGGSLPGPADLGATLVSDAGDDREEDDVQFDVGKDSPEAFIVSHGDNATMFSSSNRDIATWKRLTRSEAGDLFYFRAADKVYVSRDAAVLAEADRILEPLRALGNKQGVVGEEQGRLGERQGEIGEKQGELGEQQGRLGERLSLLAGVDNAGQHRIEEDMDALGRQMNELGQQMDALGSEMSKLGQEMDALGREMDEAGARARKELGQLAEDALRRGVAQPLAW